MVEVKNKFPLLLQDVEEKGPEEIAEAAKTILIEAAKDHIPKREKKRTPWISQQTLDKIEERRRLKGKRDEVSQRRYKELSTDIKVARRQDKKNYIKDKCRKIESHHAHNNSQEMFREINSVIKKFQPQMRVIKDKKGTIITENEDIKLRWKEYCEDMYSALKTRRRN